MKLEVGALVRIHIHQDGKDNLRLYDSSKDWYRLSPEEVVTFASTPRRIVEELINHPVSMSKPLYRLDTGNIRHDAGGVELGNCYNKFWLLPISALEQLAEQAE